jgi:hypothetical protein
LVARASPSDVGHVRLPFGRNDSSMRDEVGDRETRAEPDSKNASVSSPGVDQAGGVMKQDYAVGARFLPRSSAASMHSRRRGP